MTAASAPDLEDQDPAPDVSEWLTKDEVAEQLGVTRTTIKRMTDDGVFNPLRDATNRLRFKPSEVKWAETHRGGNKKPKEEMAEFELQTVKALLSLVKDPREKIDAILFDMIKDLRVENEKLRGVITAQQADVEAARDGNADREGALAMIKSEAAIKQFALTRIIEKASILFSGGKVGGVQLTPEQLEQLVLAGEFLTPEQENTAKAIVTAHKNGAKKDDPKRSTDSPSGN